MWGRVVIEKSAEHTQRWRRAGALTLRSSLLVAAWVAQLRYGKNRRISGADNPNLRLNDFERLARVLQDRVAVVRAQLNRGVGEVDTLRSELAQDVDTALQALGQVALHEDRPFLRRQMAQMLDSLNGLARQYGEGAVRAA